MFIKKLFIFSNQLKHNKYTFYHCYQSLGIKDTNIIKNVIKDKKSHLSTLINHQGNFRLILISG